MHSGGMNLSLTADGRVTQTQCHYFICDAMCLLVFGSTISRPYLLRHICPTVYAEGGPHILQASLMSAKQ